MRSKKNTDKERHVGLLRKIARGDDQALEAFYRIFEPRIYAFALSRLNNPHASSDVLNEVMLAVWQGASRFKGRSAVTTWVLGIAHHKIMDHLRTQSRHNAEDLDPEMPDDRDQNIGSTLKRFEDADYLRRAFAALTDEHRQVLHLAFYEDLSCREISEIIGCPETTVRTRIYYAKKSLKRWLEAKSN